MKKIIPVLGTALFLFTACQSQNNDVPDRAIRDSVRNPETVQPPAEAIPEDMKIVKDSTIVPKDTLVGTEGRTADSTK